MLHMQNVIVSFTLAVVFVLLGSVATELRWGGRHNYIYAPWISCCNGERMVKIDVFLPKLSKNKSGVPLILDHPV